MVGPQLRWWVWNTELASLGPWLGSVPYVNLQAFGIGIPLGIALLTLGIALLTRWVATGPGQIGWRIAGNVALVSIGTWPVMFSTSIPAAVLGLAGVPFETARPAGVWLILVAAGLVTAGALADAHRARVAGKVELPEGVETDRFGLVCVVVYLVVAAVCWTAAMPSYLGAREGLTPGGAPIGWLPYSMATAVLSIVIVAATHLGSSVTWNDVAHIRRGVATA
jgi:hypothetical protein